MAKAKAVEAEGASVEPTVIVPTVGRVVWYAPKRDGSCGDEGMTNHGDQPMIGFVTYVNNERNINVAGFDHAGNVFARNELQLVQEGDDHPEDGDYAMWMPYQVGQAKKHAAPAEGETAKTE